MLIEVYLYATLRERVKGYELGSPIPVELPDGSTGIELLAFLGIDPVEAALFIVNGNQCNHGLPLKPRDRVALFPPVGGG